MNKILLKELDEFIRKNNLEFKTDTLEEIYDITWKSQITIRCLKCDESFEISVKQLLRPHPARVGEVCPRCNAENLFTKKIVDLYGRNPYEFMSKFKGYYEPLTVKCIDCGSEWTTSVSRNLLMSKSAETRNHPCKKCAVKRNYKKDISSFQKKLEDKFGECNYEFINPSEFTGIYSKQKISVKCKKCNSSFDVSAQNLLFPRNGKHYCKNCNSKKCKK